MLCVLYKYDYNNDKSKDNLMHKLKHTRWFFKEEKKNFGINICYIYFFAICFFADWQAEHEETKISFTSLQAQYKRLSADHQHIVKQSKEDFMTMKESKDRESLSLQGIQLVFNELNWQ